MKELLKLLEDLMFPVTNGVIKYWVVIMVAMFLTMAYDITNGKEIDKMSAIKHLMEAQAEADHQKEAVDDFSVQARASAIDIGLMYPQTMIVVGSTKED
jgi:hypothetical protein